ncbi:MAG: hypothetical protein ACW968_12155 [Candidatus Thorarchaeota archaeon]
MESYITVALRDVLCASLSLDDGLSTIQNLAIGNTSNPELHFEVARAIEEIILRRPMLASVKLTELTVRLSFSKDRVLPEMLMLLDTRYTNPHRRAESEILPDIHAIPQLLDLLGELSQAMTIALDLNLRPLLPFLTDELGLTMDSLYARHHEATTHLAIREVHYVTWMLVEAGLFDCAEVLLDKLMTLTKDAGLNDIYFEVALDEASVLTELSMFSESRRILNELKGLATVGKDSVNLASVTFQMSLNDTRDESIPRDSARALGNEAAKMFQRVLDAGVGNQDGLGLVQLVIGSSILANGIRAELPEAIERLEISLNVFENIKARNQSQTRMMFKCLSGLGFAYGLQGDHESMTRSIRFLERASSVLSEIEESAVDCRADLAMVDNALGWISLTTDSDEFWSSGIDAFERSIAVREDLLKAGKITDLEIVGSKIGLALSKMRVSDSTDRIAQESLHDILNQYIPLFPIDSRAFTEIAIATYNVVWMNLRHGGTISHRLLRLLEDIDKMLSDARPLEESLFIDGVSLVVPYLNSSWSVLQKRASLLSNEKSGLSEVAVLMTALANARKNLEATSIEVGAGDISEVDERVKIIDPLFAQYLIGQTSLAKTVKAFYENKDYSELATGLYKSSLELNFVVDVPSPFDESTEFIQVTSTSLARILRRFALSLESHYAAYIDRAQMEQSLIKTPTDDLDFILAEDWIGLIKITDAYLEMVETSELVEAQPYLNAVFSNIARALRMMDNVSMSDRRVLSVLGDEMNRRFYLRN